ncbi:hypothetical protein [Variovorax sp. EBFNA2]|uniref:hypothetical protein n=1 Tax=Variovorax sp. EBFNA2 TaxID=3342097 RepID=UPI0029C0F919|nr:hypothetical protein [Variovorax boronicumulans]WPG38853.1 hypothetical protein RZE79_05840 [Variovorax boronicumulans]
MNFNIDIFFRINACRREIASRWDPLETGVPFPFFVDHVRSQNPMPNDCHTYVPTFILPATKASWDRYVRAAKCDQIAALETGLAYCIAAKALVPKSTADLLANAHAQCRLFDILLAAEAAATQKRKDDRVKGGKARQERLRPAKEYAFRLFRSMRPEEGWKNAGEAARAIYPHVKDFVIRNRLALLPAESLIRTIRGWLRAAFYAVV